MRQQYTIFVISNKPEKFSPINSSLSTERVNYFDGKNAKSFSEIVNQCAEMCPTEIVIMLSDKVMPKVEDISKIINLIEQGYGFVGLYRFAFFGFKKELMRQIGMFDERYLGGGFEDYDFTVRLIEANIAFYITEESLYTSSLSSWNYNNPNNLAYQHWATKWHHFWKEGSDLPTKIERTTEEEYYKYNLGNSIKTNFLPLEHSVACSSPHVVSFLEIKIDRNKKINV